MAGNRVTSILEIVTKGAKEAIGSFRQIASSTNDASTATNRATTANDTYHRGAKALYQTNLAQGRQISKLRAEIGGSSGLVAAYATLAANVFAASAAFSALSKAAQLDQLTQSLNFVGNAAGTNLGNLVTKLREVTGEAISTEQALRSASLGVSAGFSTDQLTNLARVARGASLALGRDMTDAMDRLTRGAAKLEPEILDELGIIVRLDTATAAYAAQVGKAVDQLTQYERTQAFINAINEQGEKKFGAVADAIDPNPYDKLAAALSDLSKDFLNTINSILKFTGIIDSLTSSTPALVGAIVLFASTISRQLLPALYAMPVAAAKAATRLATLSKVKLQADFTNFNRLPKVLTDLAPKFASGTASAQDFAKGMDSANRSIRGSEDALTKYSNQLRLGTITEADYAKKVADTTAKLQQSQAARQSLIAYQNAQQLASIKSNVATGLEAASQFRLKEGFKALSQATQENSARLAAMSQGAGIAAQSMNALRQGFFVAGIGARFLGAALLSFLPYLGLILTFGPMIYNFLKDKFFPKSALEQVMDRVNQTFEGIQKEFEKFAEYNSQFEITFANSFNGDKVIGAYKVLAGIASTVAEQTRRGIEAAGTETLLKMVEQRKLLSQAEKELEKIDARPKPEGVTAIRAREGVRDPIVKQIKDSKEELDKLSKTVDEAKTQAAFLVLEGAISSIANLEQLQDGTDAVKGYKDKLEELKTSSKDPVEILLEVDKAAQELNTLKASVDGIPLALGEIQKAQNDLVQKQTTPLDDLISRYGELNNNITNIQNISGVDSEAILATFRADILGITKLTEEAEQGSLSVEQAVAGYVDKLKEARSALISITIATKSLEESSKTVGDIAKTFANVLETQLVLQNTNIGLQIQSLEKQKAITTNLQQQLQFDIEIARLKKDVVGEDERAALLRKEDLNNRKAELDIEKSKADVQIQQIKNQQTINSISSLINTDTADAIDLIEQQFSRNESLASKEAALAKDKLDIEKSLANFRLQAILTLAKEEINAYKAVTEKRMQQETQLANYRQALAVLTQKQTAARLSDQTTNISFTVTGTSEIVNLISQTGRAAQAAVEATVAAGEAAANVAARQTAAAQQASEAAKASADKAKEKAEEAQKAGASKPQSSPRASQPTSGEGAAPAPTSPAGIPSQITIPVLVDLAQAEAALKEFIEKPRSVTVQVATAGATPVVENVDVNTPKVQESVDKQTKGTTAKIPAEVAVDAAPLAAAKAEAEKAVEKPIKQEVTFNAETLDQAIKIIQALIGTTENDIKLDFDTSGVQRELGNVDQQLQTAQGALEASYQRNLGILNEQAEVAKDKLSTDKASQLLALAKTKTEGQITSIIQQGAATSEALTRLEISRANEQNELIQSRILNNKEELFIKLQTVKTDEERIRIENDLAAYDALALSTSLEKISAEEERLKILKAGLDVREKENNITLQGKELAIEVFKNQKALENLRKGRGSELLVSQQLEVAEQEYNLAIQRINSEEELAKTRLEIESKLTAARLTAVAAELKSYADRPGVSPEEKANLLASAASVSSLSSTITTDLATQVGLIERSAEAQRGMAKEQLTSTQISIVSQNLPQLPQMEDMGAIKLPPIDFTAMQNQFAAARAQVDLFKNQIIADSEETMMKGLQMGQSLDDAAKNANEKADLSVFASKVRVGFDMATAAASPFIEQLKGLGPEGQYVAAIAQGGLQVVDSISTISEAFATLGDKTADSGSKLEAAASIMQSVGSAIGAIGAMQQASSAQRVAEIDKEIAAEKKRDGKSQESLAKIAALEKKKVQEEKKAFERNKKMKMAEIVINTAAAVMGIWSGVKDPFFSPTIAAMQSALVIGLGAAQLAIVSGTSFQGGGSVGGASVPSSVSVGERSNKVDVAQRPTGGELAYIQGERGMGTNANNFRPAFMGARYRATGGYVVGEQGPELFIPDAPGRIVPNDEMMQSGAPVNVNFTVSAIDATSFNDMLADQRGNIISLIREAANSYGQPFLEGVNTITMAPAQRNYYRKA